MTTEDNQGKEQRERTKVIRESGANGAVYGLGMIGAWVYYISHAATIWIGLLGIVKGIFWPAFLVYELFKFLGM